MAKRTFKKSAKVGRRGDKAPAKRVVAKAAKPRNANFLRGGYALKHVVREAKER